MEFVGGRLFLMPPCGDIQQDVAASVVGLLDRWGELHPDFVIGGNEAGMLLGEEVRAADAAVWRRQSTGPRTGGYRRVAPILAVEVAGQDEEEAELQTKARWYLDHGVEVVWLVLPETREVVVVETATERRHGLGAALSEHPHLPDLVPTVDRFFRQLLA
jgi:Uma2 family endonuclease